MNLQPIYVHLVLLGHEMGQGWAKGRMQEAAAVCRSCAGPLPRQASSAEPESHLK